MPIAPQNAYNALMANPSNFLRRYPVRIFGSTGASGVVQYAIENRGASHRPGSVLGTHGWHDSESFNIKVSNQVPNGHTFNAHSVHMDVGQANMQFYRLPSIGGPNIMVTGQLSGCSFVFSPIAHSNDVNVAHVQPQVGNSGATLRTNLAANHPNAFVFGISNQAGFYNGANRAVSVIGVRQGGIWRFYSQKQDRTTGDYRVRSVWRQYPNRSKM